MRLFLLVLLNNLLVITSYPVISQQYTYFNNRYDLNGIFEIDRCHNIVKTEDGFVISGHSIVYGESIYWWEKVLVKIDLEGQVQFIKYYGEDSIDYFFSTSPGYLISDNNHFYAVGKKRMPTSNGLHDEGTLMYLDENLDTLWMKKFGELIEPYDTAFMFTCIQKISQKDLIIAGSWKPTGLAIHVYLLKVDSMGSKIWDKSYSYFNSYIEATSIAQTTDSGFIIGCFKQTPGYPNTVDPVLIKTDSLGNQEWTKNLGGPFRDSSPMVSIALDGNIVVGSTYADTMVTSDIPSSRINIIKLDNEGNIMWNRKYGLSQENNFLQNSRILYDGSIISIGSKFEYNPEPDRVSWILKTTAEGDSVWYREYIYLAGQQSRNYLYDVIETSDNGLIACGWVDPHDPDTGSIDTWVIKLDSLGCEWAGCDTTVGIEEQGGMGAWGHGGLYLWPNPATSEIHGRLNMDDGRFYRDLTLVIYDIFGRMAPTPTLPQPGEGDGFSWQIDISALPPGIYLAVVREGATIWASAKFMVVR